MNKFENYLYSRLPGVYREADREDDEDKEGVLKRFLEVLESAFNSQNKETEELLNLIDIDNCPAKYLPYLCENLGVRYEQDIPDSYQRRFLKNSVELNKRKGTESAIKYLTRELAGAEAEIEIMGNILNVNVIKNYEGKVDTVRDQVERRKIEKYIMYYVPVFFKLAVYLYYSSFPTKIEIDNRIYSFPVYFPICNMFFTADKKGSIIREPVLLGNRLRDIVVEYPRCNAFGTHEVSNRGDNLADKRNSNKFNKISFNKQS